MLLLFPASLASRHPAPSTQPEQQQSRWPAPPSHRQRSPATIVCGTHAKSRDAAAITTQHAEVAMRTRAPTIEASAGHPPLERPVEEVAAGEPLNHPPRSGGGGRRRSRGRRPAGDKFSDFSRINGTRSRSTAVVLLLVVVRPYSVLVCTSVYTHIFYI